MKTKFLAAAFIALAPFAASADDISYSYADISYQTGTFDFGGPDADFDGFTLGLSYAVNDMWYVSFDYSDATFDPTGDLTDYTVAVGYRFGDMWYVSFGFETLDVVGFDDSGYALEGGFRTMVSDGVEINGHIGYADLGNFDTLTRYGLGAVWMFGDNMGVSFNYDMNSGDGFDFSNFGVGFRYNF